MTLATTKASITQEAADILIAAGTEAAHEIKVPMVIAVVDESGVLKAFRRMDGAALLSVDIAKDKAYTAVAFGIPTHGWYDFIKNDPPLLHGITHTPRLVVFGGGYPLYDTDYLRRELQHRLEQLGIAISEQPIDSAQ